MGKGDKKTKRGKIIKGSYGVRRPRKKSTYPVGEKKEAKVEEIVEESLKKAPTKKVAAKTTEEKPKTTAKKSAPKKTEKVETTEKPKAPAKKATKKEESEEKEKE